MPNTSLSFSDLPTNKDEFGFSAYVSALAEVINDTAIIDTPITIGVFGAWGSGKTSLMNMLLERLDTTTAESNLIIWFDSWRYSQKETLWRALLLNVVEGLKEKILNDKSNLTLLLKQKYNKTSISDDFLIKESEKLKSALDDLVASLYRDVEKEEQGNIQVDWQKAGKATVKTAVHVGVSLLPVIGPTLNLLDKAISKAQEQSVEGGDIDNLFDIFHRERSKIIRDKVKSLEQFYLQLKKLISEYLLLSSKKLIVIIDDLDRCLPEQAIGVLEAIKLFLDLPGCVFILGFDRMIIQHGIRLHYKELTQNDNPEISIPAFGRDYLDKIIQIPFEIPPLEDSAIYSFLLNRIRLIKLVEANRAKKIAQIMSLGLVANPRKLKRALNNYRLLITLAQTLEQKIKPDILAKLTVIQSVHPELYIKINENPSLITLIEILLRDEIPLMYFTPKEMIKVKIKDEWIIFSHIYKELKNVLDDTERNIVNLTQDERQGTHPINIVDVEARSLGVSSEFLDSIKELEKIQSKRCQDVIPSNLREMLKIEPFFGNMSIKELKHYLNLTKFTSSEIIEENPTPPK